MVTFALTPDIVLMVKGPMEVDIKNEASIIGKDVSDSKVFCRNGKVWPIETESACQVSLSRVSDKKIITNEFWINRRNEAGTRIWDEVIAKIFNGATVVFKSILVLGPTDSGKTTLSAYIINHAIKRGLRPVIIDADIGQGDLAPPGAIGCASVERQILDFREVNSKHFRFVGSTNPTANSRLISRSVESLIREIYRKNGNLDGIDLVVVNTDGYIFGDGICSKIAIANAIHPDMIICLGENAPNFCQVIRSRLGSKKLPLLMSTRLDQPWSYRPTVKSRTERIKRRSEQYQRYLADLIREDNAKSFSLGRIKFVHKGLTYHRAALVSGERFILLRKNRARAISKAALVNMFVGLGRASDVIGFGVISSVNKQNIKIRTEFTDIDKIYLSSIGIDVETWKHYTIRNNGTFGGKYAIPSSEQRPDP
ncbi:MAG: hypothetical protein M3297_04400 [Thermoproteota archaeon]|nr:hypothetical protein [Thermoproteota archaeon]